MVDEMEGFLVSGKTGPRHSKPTKKKIQFCLGGHLFYGGKEQMVCTLLVLGLGVIAAICERVIIVL
jgi:hypothetical protein